MRALSPSVTLDLCDQGAGASPLERALLIIEAVKRETGDQGDGAQDGEPANWSLGAVNKALLEQRGAIFGSRLELLANCPSCSSICQSEIDCLQLAATASTSADNPVVRVGGKRIAFRLPTLADVIAAAKTGGRPRDTLAKSLISDPSLELDERALIALSEGVAKADPLSSIEIALKCPECDGNWVEPFHIADLLWTELKARCDRLVMEVGRLAQAFGWSERDVLAMSRRRRHRYLELLG